MPRTGLLFAAAFVLLAAPAVAQGMEGMNMDGMDMGKAPASPPASAPVPPAPGMPPMDMPMTMQGMLGNYPMSRESSGTSWQPQAAPGMGLMTMADSWMVMGEGRVTGVLDSQSGPRGTTQPFETGMAMMMATRDLSDADTLGLRAMLSSDPFMGRRGYPLLLETGETADGVTPLVDRQHPHDLFMELAATLSHRFGETDSLFVYAGYPGEPALGPSAYMHRISGEDIPETPISHHWLDSTHVSFGVATAGFVHEDWKMEVSQFTGREPDQYRFNFDPARFDSTSARLSYNPGPNWSFQISTGFLKSPEQLTPAINENRFTASATWFLPLEDHGSLSATLAFGHKHLSDGTAEAARLLEAEYKPDDIWTLFARGESINSDELVPGNTVRGAGKLSLGAIHDWKLAAHVKAGLGGLYDFDFAPSSAIAPYGTDPHGAMAFVRLIVE